MSATLCMIVRDEADNLAACLESVRGLFGAVHVVDTGSTDGTAELARSLGARVESFSWRDDFSAARNASMANAQTPWIFWLDADDRLEGGSRSKLSALLGSLGSQPAASGPMGYQMQCASIARNGLVASSIGHIRLFRNDPRLRWERRVHEQIATSIERAGGVVTPTDIVIEHWGYVDAGTLARKTARNARLLDLESAERPGDPMTAFHRGWALALEGRHGEAVAALQLALAGLPGGQLQRKTYSLLARSSWLSGCKAQALEALSIGRTLYPDDPELLFTEAQSLAARGDLRGAEAAVRRVLDAGRGADVDCIDRSIFGPAGHYLLSVVCALQGRFAEAEEAARATVAVSPSHLLAWVVLADALTQQGGGLEALAAKAPDPASVLLRVCDAALRGSGADANRELDAFEGRGGESDPILTRARAWVASTGAQAGRKPRVLDIMRSR